QLPQVRQVFAAPIKIAILQQEAWHAEDAGGLRFALQLLELPSALIGGKGCKVGGIGTGFCGDPRGLIGALDIELALPEALERQIVVGAEDALPLGVEQADVGER